MPLEVALFERQSDQSQTPSFVITSTSCPCRRPTRFPSGRPRTHTLTKMATALVPHVSPTMEGIVYPATPTTRYVNDSVKIGTNKHQLDARLLTTESAIMRPRERARPRVERRGAGRFGNSVRDVPLKDLRHRLLFSFSNTNSRRLCGVTSLISAQSSTRGEESYQ